MNDTNTPITRWLRQYLNEANILSDIGIVARARILDLCANIDAIHEALEDENAKLRKGIMERQTTNDAEEKQENMTLWGKPGYVPYPMDTDGVPINIGDNIESVSDPATHGKVYSITLRRDGWWIYFTNIGIRPTKCRHYHEPTVADVLQEFAENIGGHSAIYTNGSEIIERYAKRLRLADD